jgi:hypothetical protein
VNLVVHQPAQRLQQLLDVREAQARRRLVQEVILSAKNVFYCNRKSSHNIVQIQYFILC